MKNFWVLGFQKITVVGAVKLALGFVLTLGANPLLAQEKAAEGTWGNMTGLIKATGTLPEISAEKVDKDEGTCMVDGKAPMDDNLIVGADGGLRDVYIMMYLDAKDAAPPIHPSYEESKKESVVLDNIKCRFEPHAIFVRTGQPLELKNSDDVGHNCHIITFANELNVTVAANDGTPVKFEKPDKTPGNVACDIHKWMDAVILIRDEPYSVISGADGKFKLDNIPAGTWKFQIWHKKKGNLKGIKIGGEETGRRGDFSVTIKDGETLDIGTIEIDVSDWK